VEEFMETKKEVTLTVFFDDRRISTMVLHEMFRTRAVTVEILRGRLSARTSWFELKLRGETRAVECIVEYCSPWSVHLPCLVPKRA
jgi:hypothetical protein